MALQSANKIRWQYTDDAGNKWAKSAEKAITDQLDTGVAKVGGIAADGSEIGSWPRSWRPRRAYFANGLTRRAVVVYDTTCVAWTSNATTLQLNSGADVATFTSSGAHLGEKKRAATSSTT